MFQLLTKNQRRLKQVSEYLEGKTLAQLNIEQCTTLKVVCTNCLADCEFEGTDTYKGKFVSLEGAQKDRKEIVDLLTEVLRQTCEYEDMMESKVKELDAELEQNIDKVQAFEKWLSLGTPFESAKFDHTRVLVEYRKLFNLEVKP